MELAQKQILSDMSDELYAHKKIYWSYDFKEKALRDFTNVFGGFSKEEVEGFEPFMWVDKGFVHVDSIDNYVKMYKNLFEGNENVSGEFLFKKRNSDEFFIMRIKYRIIKDENQNNIMAVAVGEEI